MFIPLPFRTFPPLAGCRLLYQFVQTNLSTVRRKFDFKHSLPVTIASSFAYTHTYNCLLTELYYHRCITGCRFPRSLCRLPALRLLCQRLDTCRCNDILLMPRLPVLRLNGMHTAVPMRRQGLCGATCRPELKTKLSMEKKC